MGRVPKIRCMGVLDFKEIAPGNASDGTQDAFEFFTESFLREKGFLIVSSPSRGADDGLDLVVEETRIGPGGNSRIKWLVSCKHFAHRNKSISVADETDILERVKQHKCKGFLAFYSTLPSSTLRKRIESLAESNLEYLIYSEENIEFSLLENKSSRALARRFFPESMERWSRESEFQKDYGFRFESIRCRACEKVLLGEGVEPAGIVVSQYRREEGIDRHYFSVYFVCKGDCDHDSRSRTHNDSWQEIASSCVPVGFMYHIVSLLTELQSGTSYTRSALRDLCDFLLVAFSYVCRESLDRDREFAQRDCSRIFIRELLAELENGKVFD